MYIKGLVCFFLFLSLAFSSSTFAQSSYQIGGLPAVNLNYKLKKGWTLNFKFESRHLFQRDILNAESDNSYRYVLSDYSLIGAKKVGLNSRIAGGYLLRLLGDKIVNRAIFQYSTTQNLSNLKLAHRIVFDQTFSQNETPEHRIRYRLVCEIPMNGQSADLREFYLKVGSEWLNSIQDSKYDIEIRLIPLLGYTITEKHKIEIGLDYRASSILNSNIRHNYWIALNWFIEL